MACNCSNKVEEVRELVDLSLIDPIIEKYGKVKGATITILQGVQEEFGYIPSESLTYIAQKNWYERSQALRSGNLLHAV